MCKEHKKCKDLVSVHYKDRISDLRKLWKAYQKDPETSLEDLGTLDEYGLCFDYVAPGTFSDQKRGFFRYQISCGGPQEEFRFFCDENMNITRIEFWYLDWFDGAKKTCTANKTINELWEYWKECGVIEMARKNEEEK